MPWKDLAQSGPQVWDDIKTVAEEAGPIGFLVLVSGAMWKGFVVLRDSLTEGSTITRTAYTDAITRIETERKTYTADRDAWSEERATFLTSTAQLRAEIDTLRAEIVDLRSELLRLQQDPPA